METNENFRKTVRLGTIDTGRGRFASIFCFIEFHDGRLSIQGVEGPLASGNCLGSCGQIIRMAAAWTRPMLRRFFQVWKEHHLNDLRAGSPDQEAFLAGYAEGSAKLAAAGVNSDPYPDRSAALAAAGINPDPNYLHEGKPYVYGSAWLTTPVPQDVVDFLRNLPAADQPCPWRK